MSKFRGLDTDEGWIRRELAALRRDLQEMSAARRLIVASSWAQNSLPNTNLATVFTSYISTPVLVPVGYTQAIVQLFVSAGVTYAGTSNGNVGVQPLVFSDGVIYGGPGLSNNKTGGGAISVNSGVATKVPVTAGGSLILYLAAYADGATPVDLTGNVHLSGTVIFTRN